MEIEPIVQSTSVGMQALIEYGVLGAVSCIAIGVSIIVVWVLLRQAKACFEGTKTVVDNNTKAINELKDSNKDALFGIKEALIRLETKADR